MSAVITVSKEIIKENKLIALSPDQLKQSFKINEDVSFVNFIDLSEAEALEVLKWRNHEKIRSQMFNKEEISKEEHLYFLRTLQYQNKRFYWVVKEKGQYLGVVDIVDYQGLKSEWGFYLNPELFGTRMSINLMHHALNFFFKKLKFSMLYGYCRSENIRSLMFHDLFNICHQGYVKKQLSGGDEWFSLRIIKAEEWLDQSFTIQHIKEKLLNKCDSNEIEKRKIRFDNLLLKTYNEAPSEYFYAEIHPKFLQEDPEKFKTLLKLVEKEFSIRLPENLMEQHFYYLDMLKFCL